VYAIGWASYNHGVSAPAPRLATFADLSALGESAFHEILAGELIEKAAPLPEHGLAQRALGRFIGGPFHDDDGRGGPGGWWILTEVEVELAAHEVVRPDLVGWRRHRLRAPWGLPPVRVIPDWICEVLSPSHEGRDRVQKATLYAHAGVSHYWLVAPGERFVEAFELREGIWVRLGAWQDGERVRIRPFEDVELDLSRLFPPMNPPSGIQG
jgi:Uma2 family endonuclease